jgi:hypothetical protein
LALWHDRKPDIDALCRCVPTGDRLSIDGTQAIKASPLEMPQEMCRVRLRAPDIFDRLLDAAPVQQGRGKRAGAAQAAHDRAADMNHDPYAEVLAHLEKL